MIESGRARWLVLAVNAAGFLVYLGWLAGRERRIFFDPQGAIDLLPCLGFLFVFACLAGGGDRPPTGA